MVGFIAMLYLTSIYVSSNWIITIVGHFVESVLAVRYFKHQLNYHLVNIVPGVFGVLLTTGFISYYVDLKDK